MISGIYCIENIENGKMYIGKGENVEYRMWRDHVDCQFIERSIKKHKNDGILIRYVIEYCDKDDLTYWEQYYIREWNTKVPNGYNLTDGGEGSLNPSLESREKMREAKIGKNRPPFSDEWKKNISNSLKGQNKIKHSGTISKYYGVSKYSPDKKHSYWRVAISINGKRKFLYGLKTEIEAAIAYDKYIMKHKLYKPLNFITEKDFNENIFYSSKR